MYQKRAYTDTGYLPNGIQPATDDDDATNNENAERNAVTSKGGFYISRYEAGKEGESTLVSKPGATVWNNIAVEDSDEGVKGCKTVAKEFINNENVKSALCSGIQWDMTMSFVNGKQDGSSDTDKIYNVEQYKASRHKFKNTSGQNSADRVCNIFDLEGNYQEYVAEKTSYSKLFPFVLRGGLYAGTNPASFRSVTTGAGGADANISFRFILYVI